MKSKLSITLLKLLLASLALFLDVEKMECTKDLTFFQDEIFPGGQHKQWDCIWLASSSRPSAVENHLLPNNFV